MDKLLFRRILVFALSALAIIYVAYLLISANFDMYPTENAVTTTVTDKITSDGFIIRDESVIENNSSGVLSYTYDNGEQVQSGDVIAEVYPSESDAVAQTLIEQLEAQIESLQTLQSTSLTGTVGIDVINNKIQSQITSYIDDVNGSDLSSVLSDTSSLLSSINQRMLVTGKLKNFDSQISQLQAQLEQLKSSSSNSTGTVTTDKAGYFTEFCDGYENSLSYDNISDLTLSDLQNVQQSSVTSNVAGKVINNINWYVACEVTDAEAIRLSTWDGSVTVKLSEATSESIPATIYEVKRSSDGSNALAVFKCDYMSDSILEARQEQIEIGLGTYTGLRVSRRAIHDDYVTKTTYDEDDNATTEEKKVQGVYVLYGSEVQFKEVSILYADSDYVICDASPDDDVLFSGETISLYDKIILKGDDLYDGKVIK